MDRLDIINSMLAATGTLPVTADNTSHPAYVKASAKLADVQVNVGKLKMWYNTSVRKMNPNAEGEIILPSGTVNADPVNRHLNYVKRGMRLFNMDSHSYNIPAAVDLLLTQNLPLEYIPDSALIYIRAKARYEYYLDEDGSEPKLTKYEREVGMAWIELYREHLSNKDTNHFDGPNAGRSLRRNPSRNRLAPYE